jgi:DNA-binding beta-propeller fold protein YncE
MQTQAAQARSTLAAGFAATMILFVVQATAETTTLPSNDLPNPYAVGIKFGQLPEGRQWGGVIAVTPDRDGRSIWAFERCGGNCLNSDLPAVLEFDPSGKLIKSFGAGMFVFPHGIAVDNEGNVYVADADGKNGKGNVVVKFSPEGKLLMTLGKPGMPGDAPGYFYRLLQSLSRRTARSSSPTGMAVTPMRGSSSSRPTAGSSRVGARRGLGRASLTSRMG